MGQRPWQTARQRGRRLAGVGLGLRWEFLDDLLESPRLPLRFLEVSPENYMRRGGYFPAALERIGDRYPLVTHGLTMSLGAATPPAEEYMQALRGEIERLATPWHSDHLCLSTAAGVVLHELLPLPLTRAHARRAADNVRRAQDRLGVPLAVENISYYAQPGRPEMAEVEFLRQVLEDADCGLLLDVNNVYVNAENHGFDARTFIAALPLERVVELHVAGHRRLPEDHFAAGLLLDTHGAPTPSPVQELLAYTLERTGPVPVLLERDNDVPPLETLLAEVKHLQGIYDAAVGAESDAP
jgi:uncharacterized protein (UPF0276 family)